MSLFTVDKENEYQLHGTQNWQNLDQATRKQFVSGYFHQKCPVGTKNSIKFFADDQYIYFDGNRNLKGLRLCLTTLEENFYLTGNQKTFEMKLKTKQIITVLYTHDLDEFIAFYTHLAQYCVLRAFKKHYKLGKRLGSGTFATVYNGINIFSKEAVALKVFQKDRIDNEETRLIIINEIMNLHQLRKYHLSPLIGTYQSDDCIILVLQKAEAGNMIDYLKSFSGKYDAELIKIMMKKILQNLKELHSAGFIHRDIKPQNIFFNNTSIKSSLFLGDFSLTVQKKDCQCNLIARKCSGTLGFVAPQVIDENNYDQKCDLFSIGCLFYYLHKGQSLFHSKTTKEIYNMISDKNIIFRKISNLTNLTRQSFDLLKNLLEIDPKKRISALEALNHSYFQKTQSYKVWAGEQDLTIRDYILTKTNKMFN